MPINYKNPVLNLIVAIVMVTLFFINPSYFLTGILMIFILGVIWKSNFLRSWTITIGIFLLILAALLIPNL
ncbi:hypothetical protein BA724_14100 [Domibacillus iocasae]|uniref:Uncharacterized protein n=1 Tax=Domibacillus iocasae TaxID=1714016 RepID=A0A1E7DK45_9BACI|nr:hypothetical protein BA724_14100 [Domibacillus iocasae]